MSNVRCPTYDVQRTMSGTCPEMFGALFGTFRTSLRSGNDVPGQHRGSIAPSGRTFEVLVGAPRKSHGFCQQTPKRWGLPTSVSLCHIVGKSHICPQGRNSAVRGRSGGSGGTEVPPLTSAHILELLRFLDVKARPGHCTVHVARASWAVCPWRLLNSCL